MDDLVVGDIVHLSADVRILEAGGPVRQSGQPDRLH